MKSLLALLAGFLLPFAFAPYEYYPLAILSPLLLLMAWENASPFEAARRGLLYGLACFGAGVYWIYISIHDFGNSGMLLAGLITGLFIAILAVFPACHGYVFNRYFHTSRFSKYCLVFPASWALIEWIRSWIFTGFPWLLLGYSQTASPLRGFAPVIGVYGVSFLVALSAGLLYVSPPPLFKGGRAQHGGIFTGGLLILIWLSGFALTYIHWTKPLPHPLSVTLIQGNVPQSIKWSADQALNSLALYENLTEQHWPSAPGLVVWPETAVTLFWQDAAPLLEKIDQVARQKQVALITGIPIEQDNLYYNAATVLGAGEGSYFKRHLVPFGEYTPFKKIFGKLLDILKLPMSDFVEGRLPQPLLKVQQYDVAAYICYEIAYTSLLNMDLPKANLLVAISNDTWFGQSSALGQQRQMAQFAAESTGRYLVVAANSGETVVIDPEGKILAKAPIAKTAVVKSTIYGMTGATPWIKLTDGVLIILFLLIIIIYKFYNNEN